MEISEIDILIKKLLSEEDENAYTYSSKLAEIGNEYVIEKVGELLYHESDEVKYLAAQTLSNCPSKEITIELMFDAINSPENKGKNGILLDALEEFDCSQKFVPIFKLTLSSNFKVQMAAQELLDYVEFDLSPRDIKKAKKAWSHYCYNVKQDDAFELKKREVEELFEDLDAIFEE